LFRRGIINQLRKQKNQPPYESLVVYNNLKNEAIDNLANIVRENIDMEFIKRMARL
jgi:cobyric acid synthase